MSYLLSNFTQQKFNEFFSLDNLSHYCSQVLIFILFWASLWGALGTDAEPPNGYIFNVLIILVSAHLFGQLFLLFNLPALLGMLLMGFLLTNRDIIGYSSLELNDNLSSILINIALVIIFIRAGLELDLKVIRRMSCFCLRLSFIPWIVETVVIALTSHLLLDFPFVWGFLLGFLLASVGLAVIVPPLLDFSEQGLGMDKRIPSVVIASATIDHILVLSGFNACLKIIFEEQELIFIILKALIDPWIGVTIGIGLGLILWYVPSDSSTVTMKFFLLLFGGLSAEFVLRSFDMRGAGLEASIVAAFMAALQWRKERFHIGIEHELKELWDLMEPILFGLIGTQVKISLLREKHTGLVITTLCVGLTARFITTILVTFGNNFTLNEKVFIGFAWLPKATIQAALASIPLELVNERKKKKGEHIDPHMTDYAQDILIMTFLSILFTTPLGSIAISYLGPKTLNMSEKRRGREDSILSLNFNK